MSWDDDNGQFKVVLNAEQQYSIWPAYLAAPAGWSEVGMQGTKGECLEYIDRHWTDMRPLSLRKALARTDADKVPS